MHAGRELLELARARQARALFFVGTGKNVGKTVAMRAVYEASQDCALHAGLASTGRDGEARDAADGLPKPRLPLRPGTVLATARGVLPPSPASDILGLTDLQTPAGAILLARVRHPARYELLGPPRASDVRRVVDMLLERCDLALVDGAVDRVSALAGSGAAVVVSCGASAGATLETAVDAARALVERLSVPAYDPSEPAVHCDGALTAQRAAACIASGERRQIVVRDPTQIALWGKAASHAFLALRVRCERPLHVVAVTVACIGRERSFEPRALLRAVAQATGLPTFDVYAGRRAA